MMRAKVEVVNTMKFLKEGSSSSSETKPLYKSNWNHLKIYFKVGKNQPQPSDWESTQTPVLYLAWAHFDRDKRISIHFR